MATISAAYYHHNTVRLIKGGIDYFTLLEEMIDEAQETFHLQTYILDADYTGKRIAAALIHAARRGVKVHVLLDGYASQNLPRAIIDKWIENNVHFRWFEPLFKSKHYYFGRRLHHKVAIADGTKALVGGLNISDRYNDTSKQMAWLDWAIFVEGDVAPAIETICNKWARVRRGRGHHKQNLSLLNKISYHEECAVRVRINDWVDRRRQITNSYFEMFRKATSHIIILSSYFMPGNKFRRKLKQAAMRGVRVQVVLAGPSDVKVAKYAERFVYPWLLRQNIEIYEYQKNVLHGKIATYDGKWVTAGSYNVNNISAYASIELNLDVDNVAFAQHVEKKLTEIIQNDCIRITKDIYQQSTNLFQLFLQRSAYDIIRVLLFLFTFYFKQRE